MKLYASLTPARLRSTKSSGLRILAEVFLAVVERAAVDCFIPDNYVCNPKYASDFWIVRIVEGFTDTETAKKMQDWITDPVVATAAARNGVA
jgi:hypothetical protein